MTDENKPMDQATIERLPGHQQWIRWCGGPWMCAWVHDGVVERPGTEQRIAADHPRIEWGPLALPPDALKPTISAASVPDDLRALGFEVTAHLDYQHEGKPRVFWCLTLGSLAFKATGATDAEVLDTIRRQVAADFAERMKDMAEEHGGPYREEARARFAATCDCAEIGEVCRYHNDARWRPDPLGYSVNGRIIARWASLLATRDGVTLGPPLPTWRPSTEVDNVPF